MERDDSELVLLVYFASASCWPGDVGPLEARLEVLLYSRLKAKPRENFWVNRSGFSGAPSPSGGVYALLLWASSPLCYISISISMRYEL